MLKMFRTAMQKALLFRRSHPNGAIPTSHPAAWVAVQYSTKLYQEELVVPNAQLEGAPSSLSSLPHSRRSGKRRYSA